MEAIPTSPLRRGTMLLRLSPPALEIQQLVRFRCLASPPATSTPLLALDRLILTKRIQIRPPALQRFCLTPPAQKTQLSEQPRLNLTIPASTTRPMERSLFSAIRKAEATRPSAGMRSSATSPAVATLRWAQTPESILLLATTISTSAMSVTPATPIPFEWETLVMVEYLSLLSII